MDWYLNKYCNTGDLDIFYNMWIYMVTIKIVVYIYNFDYINTLIGIWLHLWLWSSVARMFVLHVKKQKKRRKRNKYMTSVYYASLIFTNITSKTWTLESYKEIPYLWLKPTNQNLTYNMYILFCHSWISNWLIKGFKH